MYLFFLAKKISVDIGSIEKKKSSLVACCYLLGH